jgi:hypothetical protein
MRTMFFIGHILILQYLFWGFLAVTLANVCVVLWNFLFFQDYFFDWVIEDGKNSCMRSNRTVIVAFIGYNGLVDFVLLRQKVRRGLWETRVIIIQIY